MQVEDAWESHPTKVTEDRSFARVYSDHWARVFRYAYLLMRHRENAEDVAAETFERAYAAWVKGKGPSGEALPWVLVIARRVIIDRERRRRLVVWLPFVDMSDAHGSRVDDGLIASEVWLWFEQVSQLLSANQREAILLRYQLDLSYEEISRIMGMPAARVRTLVSRGLAELRKRPEVLR